MKLTQCRVVNFGSYKELDFDFSNLGLGLVYGATGSGKSTLCDIACWILYGTTAKDGNVDEVRSWQSPNEKTEGNINVETPQGLISVYRSRGRSSENDLFWVEGDQTYRGKDITDTQKMLEKRLGVSSSLYLLSAYFHEFSESGKFFTAKAKDRRQVFEQVTSLDLPIKLAVRTSEARKSAKKELTEFETQIAKLTGKVEQLGRATDDATRAENQWNVRQKSTIETLTQKHLQFEQNKAATIQELEHKVAQFDVITAARETALVDKMTALEGILKADTDYDRAIKQLESKSVCATCGGPSAEFATEIADIRTAQKRNTQYRHQFDTLRAELANLQTVESPHRAELTAARNAENTYAAAIEQAKAEVNPFQAQIARFKDEERETWTQLAAATARLKDATRRVTALSTLYDLSFHLRGELLKNTVQEIQNQTNEYLERYFDSEIRVGFALEGSDELEVSIHKNGYECVYRQLSKGQRQLLKLCFSVSVMAAAANSAGVHFDNLFFDEALDGLDATLKVKAFDLFQELEKDHESVLLIDHAPEFQNLFNKRYQVSLTSDTSTIQEENE